MVLEKFSDREKELSPGILFVPQVEKNGELFTVIAGHKFSVPKTKVVKIW